METVKIQNPDMAWHIAADLHVPPDFDRNRAYPTIISMHPIGSCKEQTSGNVYGEALAREGYVVIAYDASFQGASGGEPRRIEDPTQRVEDVRRVVDYLVTLPYVDAARIGVLGICGGGGYAINATMTERRIKAVTSITGVNFGRLSREGFGGFDPIGSLEAIAAQRTAEMRGGEARVDLFLPPSVEQGRAAGITDIDVLEATDYYRTRGPQPNGVVSALFSHRGAAVGWDAFHLAEVLLTQPLLVVIGDKPGAFGAYRDGLEIHGRAASKHKQLKVVEGGSHYDLYDQPEPVRQALAAVIPFFGQHL
ncbi:alpha/beta hydrolase [Stenotrophomonas sp. GD03930]|uniref:alpha/beta fold hydrolase n=1 Tax=unclassified Stenotrophomonas TaxID=196198 RepID=UPI001311EB46|nr:MULTISPECIES: alpha/beta hydrolase [unclassified Stenotrophomonas]MBS4802131.1 alpha/beta hydrolase [Stenotrophomonas maltophilia]MDG9986786.1 alpha/beta hydrolase [Stenotrophomonas sp. GD04024]MDH1230407.1 alpha/beta hydrolase [Stenotrophomonas sp. GD03930]HEL4297277.1 alpha/beta hydrolase [Stenotrophomonas maltophilia]